MNKLIIILSALIITSCSNDNNSIKKNDEKKAVVKTYKELINEFKIQNKEQLEAWAQKVDAMLSCIDSSKAFITSSENIKVDTFMNNIIDPELNVSHFLLNDFSNADTSQLINIDAASGCYYFSPYAFFKNKLEQYMHKKNLKIDTNHAVTKYHIKDMTQSLNSYKNQVLICYHKISDYHYEGYNASYLRLYQSWLKLTSYVFDAKSLKLLDSYSCKVTTSESITMDYVDVFEDINTDLIKNTKKAIKFMMKKHFILKNENHDFNCSINRVKFNEEEAIKQLKIRIANEENNLKKKSSK